MKREKTFELRGINRDGRATLYNRLCGYYKEVYFIGYPKKEIYRKLRNEHDCIIPREYFKRRKEAAL